MSNQTTYPMQREIAIERISTLCELIKAKDYNAIENITFEVDFSLEEFVNEFEKTEENISRFNDIDKWTNKMIDNQINEAFFRRSYLDNYYIED